MTESFTTLALGEEGYDLAASGATTMATGEEEPQPTTMAVGEEEREPTTLSLAEEDDPKLSGGSVADPFGAF